MGAKFGDLGLGGYPPRFTPDPVGGLSPPRIRIRIRFPWFCRAQNFRIRWGVEVLRYR